MPIDWVELSRAIPYVGVAIIFGLFMVIILKQAGDQRTEATRIQDAKDERRDKQFLDAMERRDTDWRNFFADQQKVRGEQWSGVVEELKGLSVLIATSTDLLRTHDSWERGMVNAAIQMGRRAGDPPFHPPSEGG